MTNSEINISIQTNGKKEAYTLRSKLELTFRGRFLRVPKGFRCDGASVPRLLWRLIFPPLDRKAVRAAFFHDFVYRSKPDTWSRALADEMFYLILLWDGVRPWRARLAYRGVRLFGGLSW